MGRPRGTKIMAAAVALSVLSLTSACGGGEGDEAAAGGAPAAECGQGSAHRDGGRQTRAMWIASVANTDWPTRAGLPPAQQKAQYRRLLDTAQSMNLNTVYVQIRPTADAFYPSPYEPWSQYLTGRQGANPGYDPLRFLVSEAHARGLEFHAWFNPYRVSKHADRSKLAPNNPARLHPDWVRRYGDALWYDPGLPQVRGQATNAVLDVVRKYDIDGVHFDDYFYPYPVAGKDFPDRATYKQYGGGYHNIADWRRANVNTLVRDLHAQIGRTRPGVQFGISPFGVWRNRSSDPAGSGTKALQSYDEIYADTRTWVKNGWLDYIAPQLYWPTGFKPASYRTLVSWWARQVSGTRVRLIIGQAAYQVGHGPGWGDPAELSRHLTINRRYPQVSGDAFFSARDLEENRKGFASRLRRDHYSGPALPPAAGGGKAPTAPRDLREKDGRLRWKGSGATWYAIYRANGRGPACIAPDGRFLVRVVPGGTREIPVPADRSGTAHTYYVTALDRRHHESPTGRGVNVTARGG